jgi:polar amino acid transport system substrate-binding protein
MRRLAAALGVCLLALAKGALADEPAPARPGPPDRVWRVGVFEAPPYAMRKPDGQWQGLTVDLWKRVASELDLQYRFGEASPETILDDVAHGRLDVAAAPFAATIDLERLVDFSHAYLSVEMGIAVRRSDEAERWVSVARTLATPTALRLYLGIVLLAFLAGAALWLLERRRNPQFSGSALRGIGSGFWWSGVTTVAVGYGDKVPITFWGRAVALLWMSVSLILITAFTAFVTAKLAVAEFGQVRGPESLRNAVVGTVEGAAAADFLRAQRIRHRIYPTAPRALEALQRGEIGAVVYGASTLGYYVARDPHQDIELLPQTFDRQNLAFPLPGGSPLRGPVNEVLNRYLTQPEWRGLKDQYLGVARPRLEQ